VASAPRAGDGTGAGQSTDVAADAEELQRLRAELAACRQLVAQVMEAEEAARRRIAQLIHDDALQSLLAANQELHEAAPGRAQVTRAHEVVSASIERLREALVALHPVTLEEGGFELALGAVTRQAERQGGFEVDVEVDPEAIGDQDELLLAVARELITNTVRHSGASRVSVRLSRVDGGVQLEVVDDGSGIPPGRREQALADGHIGLASVTQRLGAAGGTLEITDAPGGGTVALARLPSG
jgi:two-component system, NarL family, sensor kinase